MIQKKETPNRHIVLSGDTQDNPLVTAANPLLNSIPQIRHYTGHPNPTDLRQKLIDEICSFELQCQYAKLPYEVIIGARYCLCTALDEAAALTPWGVRSVWSGSGLLVTFHNETWGGEKFFQLLATLSQKPQENLLLLELINYCLQLGFEGRYRVTDNGRSQLETLKQRLFQLIHSIRGNYPPELSPALERIVAPNKLRHSSFPIWTYIAIVSFVACILYIGLNWQLENITSPVLTKIYQINLPNVSVNDRISSFMPPTLNLQDSLRHENAAGLLNVTDSADRSVITLKGDGLFNTGSTQIKNSYLSAIKHIAEIINNIKGKILIIGYTDNVPINSPSFSSNYALSLARAKSVKRELQKYLDHPERISTEGRGDNNPLLPNDTPSHRAKNRRVEIILLVSPVNQTK
ncbi:DotU family type VI secretion system protein [Xenorhabdus sp. IM139775]|uniref:DotU family type VI secretion system protein n=1 Tax=Xenorhabdus sp. IM139775 TaxID=3025876 RepID=UPI002359D75A|nr:DotU family type VI secretion system protein [Xenorhabdus sp. IM139775]MDC9592078.1 DotU family type VI secretion system protein [Xenorhabdus sp. IM139775]